MRWSLKKVFFCVEKKRRVSTSSSSRTSFWAFLFFSFFLFRFFVSSWKTLCVKWDNNGTLKNNAKREETKKRLYHYENIPSSLSNRRRQIIVKF